MSLVTTLLADQGSRSPVRSEGSWTFSPIPLLMLGVVRIYVATTTGVRLRVSLRLAWGFEACQSYSHNPLAMIGVARIDVATTMDSTGERRAKAVFFGFHRGFRGGQRAKSSCPIIN